MRKSRKTSSSNGRKLSQCLNLNPKSDLSNSLNEKSKKTLTQELNSSYFNRKNSLNADLINLTDLENSAEEGLIDSKKKESLSNFTTNPPNKTVINLIKEEDTSTFRPLSRFSEQLHYKQSESFNFSRVKNDNMLKNIMESSNREQIVGNKFFHARRYKEAIKHYEKALNTIEKNIPLENMSVNSINYTSNVIECMNNIAVCNLLMKNFDEVINLTDKVLQKNKNNFKALGYRAKALIALGNEKEAADTIKKALSIKSSKPLIKHLQEIEEKSTAEFSLSYEQKDLRVASAQDFVNNLEEERLKSLKVNKKTGFGMKFINVVILYVKEFLKKYYIWIVLAAVLLFINRKYKINDLIKILMKIFRKIK